ncbi:MAG: acyl-CoA synthetase FdrA [Ramlibacter sp.]|nr:acyl-CoA synthetase FdrA [Ramlibacter sp.]
MTTEVIPSCYQDSVVLMRISAQVRQEPGVREVALFMGTPANHALLEQAGLATAEGARARPNDLIVTVKAEGAAHASNAFERVRALLAETRKSAATASAQRPRSLDGALRALPDANLLALSVPGAYVRGEAMSALRRGLHLFIFSDNVPVEDEIALKNEAVRRGLLCMGPDQGTAYLGGAGLGFANVVARGRVGCVAASGTGLQAVVARLDALGEGVSHGIGVGGRDLSEAVGGTMTLFALDLLSADPATEAIVVISKPPHPSVLAKLEAKLATIRKPVVLCCVGAGARSAGKAVWVETLDQAADAALALLAGRRWEPVRFGDAAAVHTQLAQAVRLGDFEGRRILGLYTGGTLAYETGYLFKRVFGAQHPHRVLDLGDDQYTVGRPHPMIDPAVRGAKLLEAAGDPAVGVVLLDLVLGKGSHENPAGPLAAAAQEARRIARRDGRGLALLASVIGTRGDPQGLGAQTARLEQAGIGVLACNADAARCAAMLVHGELRDRWTKSREVA